MAAATVTLGAVMLEARPFRPFKSSEEYLWAMKEDLAEWLTVLYPELRITADNFLDRLDTGVALCKHANAVRESARVLLEGTEAGGTEPEEAVSLAKALRSRPPVTLLPAARPGTFFARDNVSNFIDWCRKALSILECLLFETDDLCLRKNEKHVVLCLLEVARRGAVLGMPAPLLVQMEKQIERELAGEESPPEQSVLGLVPLGPQPQLVTNDLRSLDERVRDLVERCSCPTQFPMVRVSEGKYRIGDTKILIFVRILRAHVMVRVGGGWDTLAHYLDKHDPCRCRAQHRASLAARLSRPRPGLSGATVTYERAPLSLGYGGAPPATEEPGDEATASLPYMPDWTLHDSGASCGSPERTRRGGSGARGSPGGAAASPGRLSLSPERRSRPAGPHCSPQHRARSPRAASPGSGGGGGGGGVAGGESASDNGSEVSDEGYRSLGLAPSAQSSPPALGPNSNSLTPADDADYTERLAREESAGCEGGGRNGAGREDVSLVTGLRKTGYSAIYGGAGTPVPAPASPPATSLHSPDTPSNHAPTQNLHPRQPSRIPHSPVRKSTSRSSTPSPKHAPNIPATPKTPRPPSASRNTWSGRSGPGGRAKSRPTICADTFESPKKVQAKVTDKLQERAQEPFRRNTPLRSSSASLRTPPQKPLSPLLETILRSAETAKDDAAVLERMKDIIRQFSKGDKERGELSRSNSKESAVAGGAGSGVEWAEWTRAWVMSSGRLERSASSRQLSAPPACAPLPTSCARPRARADARATPSRIPAPLPIACRRSASTTNFP